MRFVIVTGLSGAGKSTALKMLEDNGYFCVDNLPIPLIGKFAEISLDGVCSEIKTVAIGVDIRNGQALGLLGDALEELKTAGFQYEILFLDASDEVLVKRYKETRRTHPLSGRGRLEDGIRLERERMVFLKEQADYIIDTSSLFTRELKTELEQIFLGNKDFKNLFVSVVSFGFKFGIPTDADLIFDVRFLPNPYYVDHLRVHTGNDQDVYDFVMENEDAKIFREKLVDMIKFLIPRYIAEGKNQLVVGIGCTGGKHRSVTLANALYESLSGGENYGLRVEHRDIEKDAVKKKFQYEV